MTSTTPDKIRGLLFGLAAGDQIGGPIHMAIELSKSLLDRGRFDEKSILRHYYTWWNAVGFDTGYVAHNVFYKMKNHKLNREAVAEVHAETGQMTGGCNPMHRAVPLALLKSDLVFEVAQHALTEAKLTHYDPIAGYCSRFVVMICRFLLLGKTLPESLSLAYQAPHNPQVLLDDLADVIHFDKANPKPSKPLSDGGYSPDVLRTAIYFLQTNDTFNSTLSSAMAFAGGANFCPVVVGAIAGTLYGYDAIPEHFMQHIMLIPELEDISNQFIKLWNSENSDTL